jgi:hypothetical protein
MAQVYGILQYSIYLYVPLKSAYLGLQEFPIASRTKSGFPAVLDAFDDASQVDVYEMPFV